MIEPIKYYKYVPRGPVSRRPWPYGTIWIYQLEPNSDLQVPGEYQLSIFNRNTRQWVKLVPCNRVSNNLKLLTKQELFLELL